MSNFTNGASYIVSRLRERATWTALAMAASGFGMAIKPDQWQAIAIIGMGMAGVVAAFLPPNIQEKDIVPSPSAAPPTPLAQSLADNPAVQSAQSFTNMRGNSDDRDG